MAKFQPFVFSCVFKQNQLHQESNKVRSTPFLLQEEQVAKDKQETVERDPSQSLILYLLTEYFSLPSTLRYIPVRPKPKPATSAGTAAPNWC